MAWSCVWGVGVQVLELLKIMQPYALICISCLLGVARFVPTAFLPYHVLLVRGFTLYINYTNQDNLWG